MITLQRPVKLPLAAIRLWWHHVPLRGTMKKLILILFTILIMPWGCASLMMLPSQPIIVSQPPEVLPEGKLSIGLVRLERPLNFGKNYNETFLRDLADSLDTGMQSACKLITPDVSVFQAVPDSPDVDVLLIPTNVYFEMGKSKYSVEVTISMDVIMKIKGRTGKKGILIEAVGRPGGPRPKRQINIGGATWGLIGSKIKGDSHERAINYGLFNFSIKFAEKVESRVSKIKPS